MAVRFLGRAVPSWPAPALARLSKRQLLTLFFALVLSAVVGYAGYMRFASPASPVQLSVAPVRVGSLVATVSANGNVAQARQAKLTFAASGRIKEMLVKPGDRVSAGQVLARLDTAPLETKLASAQSNLRTAQIKFDQLVAGARPEDVAAARAAFDAAMAKYQDLLAGARPEDLAAAQSSLDQARSNLASAEARYAQVRAGATEADVVAAQGAVEQARATLAAAQANLDRLRQPDERDVAMARNAVANAEANLAAARARLEQLRRGPTADEVTAAEVAVENARTALSAAEARLAYLKASPTPADLASAERDVVSAQATLAAAEATLTEKRNILAAAIDRNQPITYEMENAVRTAEAQVNAARQGLAAAQARLAQVKAGPSEADLVSAQVQVDQAKANLRSAEARLTQVKAGPTEADLTSAESAVRTAQGALDDARLKLAALVEGPTAADLAQAEGQVANATASLRSAEAKLKALLGGATPEDLAIAQAAVDAAQAGVRAAETKLAQLKAGALESEIQAAAASVASARATLAAKAGVDPAEVALAQEQVRSAEIAVRQAEIELSNATLVAPFDGVVLSVEGNPGEQAGSTASVTIADTGQKRIEVSVDENDVAKLQVGQRVLVTFDALPDQRLNGRVAMIAPSAVVQQGVATYPVWIEIDPGSRTLPGGMTASVSIVVDERQNVLVIPNRAIRQTARGRTVEVLLPDGSRETRVVQVGLSNDQMSEIVSGLREGEIVVLPTTTTTQPNVRGAPGLGAPMVVPGGGFPRR